jgi:hypothetical protein
VDDLSALKILSYTGMLTIAIIIDRGQGLDLDKLIVGLQNESELITRQADACCDPGRLEYLVAFGEAGHDLLVVDRTDDHGAATVLSGSNVVSRCTDREQ